MPRQSKSNVGARSKGSKGKAPVRGANGKAPVYGDIRNFFATPASTGPSNAKTEAQLDIAANANEAPCHDDDEDCLFAGGSDHESSHDFDAACDEVEACSADEVEAQRDLPGVHDVSEDYIDDSDDSDDEYVAVDEDEDDAQHEDESMEEETDSFRPSKRPRLGTAEEWVHDYNEKNPVSDEDKDLKRFQSKFQEFLVRLHNFACDDEDGELKDWKSIPRDHRAMTKGFRRMISTIHPNDLGKKIMKDHMPRKVQQILGRESLTPLDLLELPKPPVGTRHRLTYADIPVRVGVENICQRNSKLSTSSKGTVKSVKSGVVLDPLMEAGVYAGSSLRPSGGMDRVVDHEKAANKVRNIESNIKHYKFSAQADVVPSFHIFGLWTNPDAMEQVPEQDPERWMPCFLEGILMAYLGLYTRRNRAFGDKAMIIFSDESYDLVAALREGLQLPNLARWSLNRAWPLMQGVPNGMVTATHCANEGCRAPNVGKFPKKPYYFGSKKFRSINGDCYGYARKNDGQLRSREGRANGYFAREAFADDVNKVWFADGNARQCYNAACGVAIPEHADIFGFMKGIRCRRCHTHARKNKVEWQPDGVVVDDGTCDKCGSNEVAIHGHGGKMHCDDCNIIQCCFDNETEANNTSRTSKVVHACANPGCQSAAIENMTNLVEDIVSHKWRCLPCDWSVSTLGVEIPEGLQQVPKPADEAFRGPIPHHRFNDTKCVDCDRYATFSQWTEAENGYKCGLCDHKPCAGINCQTHIVLMTSMRPGGKPDEYLCVPCYFAGQRRSRQDRRENPLGRLQRSEDWVCGNTVCPYATTKWNGDWGYIEGRRKDASARRCSSCFRYWKANGRDRTKFNQENGRQDRSQGRLCEACSCFEPPGGKGAGWGYQEGKFLCRKCWQYYDRHGEHFDPSNPDKFSRRMPKDRKCCNCSRTKADLKKSEAFHFQEGYPRDESHVRCTRCFRHFTSNKNRHRLEWPEKDW
ncbi:unnamed protein product [Clonostachys rosea]|uniref:GATA-type domain-containing protein n=1 Tax=Bionectria ochroleuca TaxID=29856 RepID=A0ABY6TY03_BIOOC|nr:unnamed protein product [Clonostachys rosea]